MVDSALALAKITSEDPFAGIPEPSQLGKLEGDLGLYYDDVYSLSTADRIDYARRAEKAALEADPRIVNSEGGTFDAAIGYKVLANSHGFVGDYQRSYCSVSAVPIAQIEGSAMQRDYWYSVANDAEEAGIARRSRHRSPPSGRCAASARARSRPRRFPSSSSTPSPARWSATSSRRSMATRSIAARRSSPAS